MPVSGATNLPIGPRDKEWNGSDARRRVIDHYTSNGKTNWSQVKKAFFWIDSGKEDQVTGYNLGFADVVDGTLKAIPRGLFAVAGGHGVQRIQAPSASEKNAIKRKVNTYYRKMKAAFPNDDFAFDPPFPEVKEEHMEISEEQPEKTMKALFKEIGEKFYPMHGGATSFADLSAMEAVREAINKVFKTVYAFEELAANVARQAENPGDLVSGLQSLTDEMSAIFKNMDFEEEAEGSKENNQGLTCFFNSHDLGKTPNWEVKQNGSAALLKNEKGDQFFYGRFTNNIWDKDGEVLITEAHQDFVDYLDSHPDEAPELWDWHEEETAKEHRAIWWDFADGFLHAIWPVNEDEAKGIQDFMEEFEPGMSHGFNVLEREGKEITKYQTFEASILPREFAANEWTTFDLVQTAKEKKKMFTPEKQRALELLSLGRYRAPLGKASEADAAKIDETGAQRKTIINEKGNGKMSDQTTVDQATTEEPIAPVTETPQAEAAPPLEAPTEATLEALEAHIVNGFQLLTERLDSMDERMKSTEDALKGIKETKGQSPSVAAWVAAQKASQIPSAVGAPESDGPTEDKGRKPKVDPNDLLFGDGPEEAAYEIDGHLLAGL